MPRDAETNNFLISEMKGKDLYFFWFGLNKKRRRFEWVDGSALGTFTYWAPGQPDGGGCANYADIAVGRKSKFKWREDPCDTHYIGFICQVAPGD
ncbi:collectin-10-like [Branchiostoma floridae x Branchiostoma japonicum]